MAVIAHDIRAVPLRVVPSSIKAATAWVSAHHRHLPRVVGGLFACGVETDAGMVGMAIVGRPVARMADTGWRAEITRVATDGTYNACSMLYGACARAAKALGYCEITTATLPEEGGASLRASGFDSLGLSEGGEWSRPARARLAAVRPEPKTRWRRRLCAGCTRCLAPPPVYDPTETNEPAFALIDTQEPA